MKKFIIIKFIIFVFKCLSNPDLKNCLGSWNSLTVHKPQCEWVKMCSYLTSNSYTMSSAASEKERLHQDLLQYTLSNNSYGTLNSHWLAIINNDWHIALNYYCLPEGPLLFLESVRVAWYISTLQVCDHYVDLTSYCYKYTAIKQ